MPDRLSELVRQRALILDHLAWLDREIASVTAKPVIPPLAPSPPSPAPPPAAIGAATVAVTATPPNVLPTEEILDQYRVAPAALKKDVRKGCLLYFVGAFVLLGVVVAILYFAIGTH